MLHEFKARPREEVQEKIKDYIVSNNIRPHEKLPSERKMSEMWNRNRMTLRSAIQTLTMEGVLYSKIGSGTYVAAPKFERNLQDLKSFSKAVVEAEQKIDTEVISKRVIECNKQISKKLKLLLGHKVFEMVRLRKIDDEAVMIETTYVDYEKYRDFESHDFSSESLYKIMEESYGTIIFEGKEKISITYATDEEARLLNIDSGVPMFFLTGIVYDNNGTPVEYFKTVARSDKIRFSSTLTMVSNK